MPAVNGKYSNLAFAFRGYPTCRQGQRVDGIYLDATQIASMLYEVCLKQAAVSMAGAVGVLVLSFK
jgi:hypothetical protein